MKNTTLVWDNEQQVPFAYHDKEWVGFDDERSLKMKVLFLLFYYEQYNNYIISYMVLLFLNMFKFSVVVYNSVIITTILLLIINRIVYYRKITYLHELCRLEIFV